MKIDMLMLLYLRFADFPIVLIRSWSWEYSKDEADDEDEAEEHLRSPLGRNYTQIIEGKKVKFTKSLTGSSKLRYTRKLLIIQIVTQRGGNKNPERKPAKRKMFPLVQINLNH